MMEQHNRLSTSACSQNAICQHSTRLQTNCQHSSEQKTKKEAKQKSYIQQMSQGQGQTNKQKDKQKVKQQEKNSQKNQNKHFQQQIHRKDDTRVSSKGDNCESKYKTQNVIQMKSVLQSKTMGDKQQAKDSLKGKISQDTLGKGKEGEHRVFRKGDLIVNAKKNITYQAVELIGTGTFGQVLSVISISKSQHGQTFNKMALKVIKNQPAYINQGLMEIKSLREIAKHEQLLLKKINEDGQKIQIEADKSYLRLYDGFMWEGHLCIAMELMDNSILNILQSSRYKGIDMKWIQKWGKEIVLMLAKIHKLGIIHCDIKPQNIMFRPQKPERPILIDFSSSSISNSPIFTYIQSRFYRSPEVLIGTLPYTYKIDIWSLGCLLAEMYLGLPIFPGASAYDQISKIFKLCKRTNNNIKVDSFDEQTLQMVRKSKFGLEFFEIRQQVVQVKKTEEQRLEQFNNQAFRRNKLENQREQKEVKNQLTLKPLKAYERQKKEKVQINQQYFEISCLSQLVSIRNPPAKQLQTHELFVDLVKKLLVFNPENRITAEEAFLHPFFGGTFSQLEPIRVLEDMIFQEKSSSI